MTKRMGSPARWKGKTVLVTGSTSGIGRAAATRFAAEGAHVVISGVSELEVHRTVAELAGGGMKASGLACDLTEPASATDLVRFANEEGGRLDVLVNNAGANVFSGVAATSLDEWERCINLDLRAAWLCSREAAPRMLQGGAIVNISSTHAFATLPGCFPYNVAKAGVVALSSSLALEYAYLGIRVNTVCPGYIDTPINDAYFSTFADPASARARAERLHPGGRLGTVDEIARVIEFLSSPDCMFMTGSVVTVDGGRAALLEDAF